MQIRRLVNSVAAVVFVLGTVLAGPCAVATDDRPGQISVAYFQQWPAPIQFAQENKTLDAVLGMQVDWVPFSSGREMAAALAAGKVQIAYSLGHVPFLVAVNSGLELSVIGIAVSYPEDDNCILRADAGIDRSNASQLAGKTIALRPGSVSHFRMLKVLAHLGVNPSKVTIMPVPDGDSALQALQQRKAVMACANGTALRRMSALGQPLLSGAEQDALGLKLFDVVAVSTDFMQQHADILQAFMDVTEASDRQWRMNPEPMRRAIARAANMDRASASDTLRGFVFPLAAEQKSKAWLGGQVLAYNGEIAAFFAAYGQLDKTLGNYDHFFTTRFLR
jgi:taurine transport system substrate-binding protein